MLSIMPPVLPILKAPGLIPPTVAGPIMVMPFFFAMCKISRARYVYVNLDAGGRFNKDRITLSGTPSAIIAIDLIWGNSISSNVEL